MTVHKLDPKTQLPQGEPTHGRKDTKWLKSTLEGLQFYDFNEGFGRFLKKGDLQGKAREYYDSLKGREPRAHLKEFGGVDVITVSYFTRTRENVIVKLFDKSGAPLHDGDGHKLGKGRINLGQSADWSE